MNEKGVETIKKGESLEPEFITKQKEIILSRIKKYSDLEKFRQTMIEGGERAQGIGYLLYKNSQVLPQLRKALQKIEDGSYGVCEKCSKPIEKERLEIVPGALVCMECIKKN